MSGRVGSITTDIIADGLVFNMDAANRACYPKTGTTATDTIGNTSGTLNGATFQNTNSGVFNFDGTDDSISLGNAAQAPNTQPGAQFTFSSWIYPTSNVSWSAILGAASTNQLFIGYSGSNTFIVRKLNIGNIISYSTLPSDSTWTNICVTRDSNSLITLYYDAVSKSTATDSIDFTDGNNYIGNDGGNGADWYGNIGPINYYNRALSASEVLHNYNALKGRFA